MKAAVINQYGDRNELTVVDTAVPAIQADEVLVENIATSINPIDYKAREGLLQRMFQWQFPVVLGWDVAGKIVAVGDNVTGFKVGDAVFARPDIDPIGRNGSYAEYTAVKADKLALKPVNVSFAEAAAVTLAGLTALQMLQQLQVSATTASQANHDFVVGLGADEVIDYHTTNIQDVLSDYDAVFDMVGDVDNGLAILKPGGHFVTISAALTDAQKATADKTVREGWLQPNGKDLAVLAADIAAGDLKIVVDSVYPLTTVGIRSAHERSETHHARGKIVVQIKPEENGGE